MQTVELTGGCGAHLAHSVDIYGHTSHLIENCFRTKVLLSIRKMESISQYFVLPIVLGLFQICTFM